MLGDVAPPSAHLTKLRKLQSRIRAVFSFTGGGAGVSETKADESKSGGGDGEDDDDDDDAGECLNHRCLSYDIQFCAVASLSV